MKILIVHPSFHFYGGAEIQITQFVKFLLSKNVKVDILTLFMVPDVKDEVKGANVIFCRDFAEMKTLLNKDVVKYDLVNFYNHPVETMLEVEYPSVWYCNEPPDIVLDGGKLSEEEVKHVTSTVTKFVVADEKNADRFKEVYGIEPDTIPYGVDYKFWSSEEEDKYKWYNHGKYTIVHSAAIHPRKGQVETVKAFAELKKTLPDIKLYLAGLVVDFKYYMEVVKVAQEHGLTTEDVLFLDMLSRKELKSLFHSCDLLVHPIGNQGGWLTPLEAIACGLYPLVSKESNISSLIESANLGTVSSGDLVKDITECYNNKVKVSKRQINMVKTFFSWSKYNDSLYTMFRSMVK